MKLKFSGQNFEKNISNMKFKQNSFSEGRVVPCGRTNGRTDSQTDMTNLIVDLCTYANARKINSKLNDLIVRDHFTYVVIDGRRTFQDP